MKLTGLTVLISFLFIVVSFSLGAENVSSYEGLTWGEARPARRTGSSEGLESYLIQKIERMENGKKVYYYRVSNPNSETVKIHLALNNPAHDIEFTGILNDLTIKRQWAKSPEEVRYAKNPPFEHFMKPDSSFLVRMVCDDPGDSSQSGPHYTPVFGEGPTHRPTEWELKKFADSERIAQTNVKTRPSSNNTKNVQKPVGDFWAESATSASVPEIDRKEAVQPDFWSGDEALSPSPAKESRPVTSPDDSGNFWAGNQETVEEVSRKERLAEQEKEAEKAAAEVEKKQKPGASPSIKSAPQPTFTADGKEWLVGKDGLNWNETQSWINSLGGGWRPPARAELKSLQKVVGKSSPIEDYVVWAATKDSSLACSIAFSRGDDILFPIDFRGHKFRAVAVR